MSQPDNLDLLTANQLANDIEAESITLAKERGENGEVDEEFFKELLKRVEKNSAVFKLDPTTSLLPDKASCQLTSANGLGKINITTGTNTNPEFYVAVSTTQPIPGYAKPYGTLDGVQAYVSRLVLGRLFVVTTKGTSGCIFTTTEAVKASVGSGLGTWINV
ncbi:hypothetical protein RhiJN_20056 [Ceratobasidium sp. AG-Ba]|nr:hypothetical protein RhiJN_20056 [Ceratobasidium sp. AG-Ba]